MDSPIVLSRTFLVSPLHPTSSTLIGVPFWWQSDTVTVALDHNHPFIIFRRNQPHVMYSDGSQTIPMIAVKATHCLAGSAPPSAGELMVVQPANFLVPVSNLFCNRNSTAPILARDTPILDRNSRAPILSRDPPADRCTVKIKFAGAPIGHEELWGFFRLSSFRSKGVAVVWNQKYTPENEVDASVARVHKNSISGAIWSMSFIPQDPNQSKGHNPIFAVGMNRSGAVLNEFLLLGWNIREQDVYVISQLQLSNCKEHVVDVETTVLNREASITFSGPAAVDMVFDAYSGREVLCEINEKFCWAYPLWFWLGTQNDRRAFITFSRGRAPSEAEIYGYFNRERPMLEVVRFQKVAASQVPLYAHLFFYTSAAVQQLVEETPVFTLGGKRIEVKRHIQRT